MLFHVYCFSYSGISFVCILWYVYIYISCYQYFIICIIVICRSRESFLLSSEEIMRCCEMYRREMPDFLLGLQLSLHEKGMS